MMRRLYDWIMELAASDRAPSALFWVSFIESSFFPIPPDVMLIPMAIANRAKAWWYATIATIGSVLGGLLGYLIGYLLFDLVGKPILNLYGYTDKFQEFAAQYNEYGAWIVFMAGLTPFPYKVITIASGTTSMNVLLFIIASIAGRAGRFFAVAGLLYFFGQPIRAFIERYFGILTVLFFVLLLGGFAAVRFLL
jgi:membrane protein YqaA with SNARE-associated domain